MLALAATAAPGTGPLRVSAHAQPELEAQAPAQAAGGAAAGNAAPASLGPAVGYFEGTADIGAPAITGSTTYDAAAQTYTMSAGGTNMWGARDEFQFAWRRMSGDFTMRAHVKFLSQGVDPHRKIGIIVRKGLDADAPYVDATVHGDGLTSLQHRQVAGGVTATISAAITHADVIELKREGRRFLMGVARFGDPMVYTELYGPDLGDEVHAGLFVCSHNPAVKETARFSNVRIIVPPKAGWVPYRDYIGSNLEVMDVATGARTVVHTSPISIQAPNWTVDGRSLLFNGSGRLWTLDLATRAVSQLDTGKATRNNNDHVFSHDGTMLGISHHSQDPGDNGRSVIYVLPATGGEPRRVTANAPSYLHGWSLDKQWLFYTGQRNGELDIYKIRVDGGDEVRLTSTAGVDDGSELTPDGQWLYFNSNRSGHMQIWRMRPDGSDQQQITFDRFNNWFPHISPDGTSMVVISYGEDIDFADHPFYRHVYLRHMAVDGSNLKVIAYVFGGQGTINVPSWSPDGTRIAFVSNTALPAPH
jgi:Tol biopolymer transport system component